MPDQPLFKFYLFTLLWMPIPAGSNWPWAWMLLQVMVFSMASVWLLLYLKGKVKCNSAFKGALIALILLGMWLLWVMLQLLPIPVSWLDLIAPHSYELAQQAAEITGLAFNTANITVDSQRSFYKLMFSVTLVTFFMLSIVLLNSRRRVKWLLWLIVVSALFQSVFGSLMTLSGIEHHLFGAKQHYRGFATGTFINRNHLAGYLEMSLALGIGLLLSQLKNTSQSSWRQLLRNWVAVLLDKKMLLRVMLAIMVIGLVLTRSRMGNTAFFSSLLLSSLLWVAFSGQGLKRNTIILFVSLILVDLFIVGQWFGIEKVIDRLEKSSAESETRDEVFESVLVAIPDYGFAGSGLGTFRIVFPAYKNIKISKSTHYAHNDYLQFALEGGIGAAFLSAVVLMALLIALRAIRNRRDPLYRGLGFASLMGIIAILIHSTVDFNLQIPANAMMFMLLLALAWVAAFGQKGNISCHLSINQLKRNDAGKEKNCPSTKVKTDQSTHKQVQFY
jgi:putative inorganic carbon (HCO3(-)) transporter